MNLKKCVLVSILSLALIPSGTQIKAVKKVIVNIADKIAYKTNAFKQLEEEGEVTTTNNLTISVKLDYEQFVSNETCTSKDLDVVKAYRRELLRKGKEYHTTNNEEIISNMDLSSFSDSNMYVSTYSPFVSFEVENENISDETYQEIQKLAQYEYVDEIIVGEIYEKKANLIEATEVVQVKEFVDAGGLTGEGLVVGVLEPSVLDASHQNFVNTNLEVRDEWYYVETVHEHTTKVGSIIAGVNGIAKGVKLLSVEVFGNLEGEIDWMLDREVNIVNCSYGEANPDGVYSNDSAYVDYIADTYKVLFVASAGNEGEGSGYIGNPGLGFNVLTVGASASDSLHKLTFSSYTSENGSTKPTLLAPGDYLTVFPFYDCVGTSFAAPIVTGCAALLMDAIPDCVMRPELVISFLATNTDTLSGYDLNRLKPGIGTGRLNFKSIQQNFYRFERRENTDDSFIDEYNIYVREGETIRASVAWFAQSDGTVDGISITDYDLYLLKDNVIVASSTRNIDTVEFIEYKAPETEFYVLRIKQFGTKARNDLLSYTWCIRPAVSE